MENRAASLACLHCGAPVPSTQPAGSRFCCAGCAFVHGLEAGAAANRNTQPDSETILQVEGVTCSACVTRIEAVLGALEGVAEARLNVATRRVRIAHTESVGLDTFLRTLAQAGYRGHEPRDAAAWERAERRRSLWRLALAGFAMMQIMMFAFPAYVADEGSLPWDVERLFALASLALTLPVLLVSARPIFAAALRGVVTRQPGMDLPVAIGIAVSFAASLANTFNGGDVYYDSIAMFVFFLLAARHLERAALAHAGEATGSLAQLLPRKARRANGVRLEEVDCTSLAVGDVVVVGTGEAAPADAVVLDVPTLFDEALVTGESAPVEKQVGDTVLAGTVNLAAPARARVVRAGADQTLERIRTLVERAAADKPRWTLFADRVARHFSLAVVGLAAAGALVWAFVEPHRALWVAVATLVVSCPCALALATPAAMTAAVNRLARRGVLVTRASALEALAEVTHFVFDKTGTLTTGRLRLSDVETFAAVARDECLLLAASLEAALPHPIAHALAGAVAGPVAAATNVRVHAGEGVEGDLGGRHYRVGSARFCGAAADPLRDDDAVPGAYLSRDGEILAWFRFEDAVRPEAAALVTRLREAGCEVMILSGDRRAVVEPVAAALGIRERVAGADPAAKAAFIARLSSLGAKVAMIGDGVNDAPGLAGAHVAIAPANGTALAQSQADFLLVNPDLGGIAEALLTARRTSAIVRQNLAWAAAYNAIALPLALGGWLTPWLASLGMSVSSLAVVANALRLSRA